MAQAHEMIATLALSAAARLELEESLGLGYLNISPEARTVTPAEIKPHTTPYQPPSPVAPISTDNTPRPGLENEDRKISTQPMPDFRQQTEASTAEKSASTLYSPEPIEQVQPQHTGSAQKIAAISSTCQQALSCQACELCRSRRQVVFGEGSLEAKVLFICESPGREEDLQGRPFVGPAGGLLTEVVEKGMKLSRGEAYFTNIVKCRPPGNRELHTQEIECCLPYLRKQLEIIQPQAIVAVGGKTAGILTGQKCSIEQLRGVWHEFEGIPLMPVYHTSFLLRKRRMNGNERTQYDRILWQDIKLVMRKLGMKI